MKNFAILLFLMFIISCSLFTRTIYVPHGQSVRLRTTLKNTPIWVRARDGEIIAGKMSLPEGWYCLPGIGGDDGE